MVPVLSSQFSVDILKLSIVEERPELSFGFRVKFSAYDGQLDRVTVQQDIFYITSFVLRQI